MAVVSEQLHLKVLVQLVYTRSQEKNCEKYELSETPPKRRMPKFEFYTEYDAGQMKIPMKGKETQEGNYYCVTRQNYRHVNTYVAGMFLVPFTSWQI